MTRGRTVAGADPVASGKTLEARAIAFPTDGRVVVCGNSVDTSSGDSTIFFYGFMVSEVLISNPAAKAAGFFCAYDLRNRLVGVIVALLRRSIVRVIVAKVVAEQSVAQPLQL